MYDNICNYYDVYIILYYIILYYIILYYIILYYIILYYNIIILLRKPADRLGKVVLANEVSIRGSGGWSSRMVPKSRN